MSGSIWSILGIEQTTDHNVIRQAYSEQLKKYHPEDHPEEFQKLQEAYRIAREYANGKSKASAGIDEIPGMQIANHGILEQDKRDNLHNVNLNVTVSDSKEPVRNEKRDTIPDYIVGINNLDSRKKYLEDMDEYILFLKGKLIGRQSKKDLRALDELFRDNRFCTIIRMPEFFERYFLFIDVRTKLNRKAAAIMYDNLQHLISGSVEVSADISKLRFYFHLHSKKEEKYDEEKMKATLHVMIVAMSVVGAFFLLTFILDKADIGYYYSSAKHEDADEERLIITADGIRGVTKQPEDILESEKTDFFIYVFFYLGEKVIYNSVDNSIVFTVQITNSEEKDFLMKQFSNMLEEYCQLTMLSESELDYTINILSEDNETIESITGKITKENQSDVCDILSQELDEFLDKINDGK